MVKQLNYIKNFGIFKDFKWTNEIAEFKEKNVIYGWNYSGKTTLSRVFSSLRDRKIHSQFETADFQLSLYSGEVIGKGNISEFPFEVRVFNSEFIRENLRWEVSKNLNAIAFDVGENVIIRNEIKRLQELLTGLKTRKTRLQPAIDEFELFEKQKFSTHALFIKNDILNSLIDFDKRHLKKVLKEIEKDLHGNIITSQPKLTELKKLAIASSIPEKLPLISATFRLQYLHTQVEDILKQQPEKEQVIEILDENTDIYSWAKKGHELHQANSQCGFCGNTLSNSRFALLKTYFSNAAAKLRERITDCRIELLAEADSMNSINFPRSKNDFVDKYQSDYDELWKQFTDAKAQYFDYLARLQTSLEKKELHSLFEPIDIMPYPPEIAEGCQKAIDGIALLIENNNNFVENFETERTKCQEILKRHVLAEFLIAEEYAHKEQLKNDAEKRQDGYENLITNVNDKIMRHEASLKSVLAGKEELNKYIKAFLQRDDITIEVSETDQFYLKRGNNYAELLSEGEKMAISFAYFLVSLESLHHENKLRETIVFIDDPISSLDANHIAQIYSLINSFFFRKGIDPSNPEMWINCFKQLFISTHNFDFFSFLKDSTQLTKCTKTQPLTGCNFYLTTRISQTSSTIKNLPASLKRKSEYLYLFELLHKFYESGCPMEDDKYILIPNALRRFFEIYSLLKMPGSSGEIDSRLNTLISGTHNLKLLHHLSHFTTFEKLTKHDELGLNLPTAVGELMQLLKSDTVHYESLVSATQ